ncbi:MAG TPA: hydroxymethylglutaryl-CoA lyase [Steroidobacteraceae bacterium]|nr:hydroxymethylglutaryl-CoA lyase [Steroidobacteraceae bacterium]
MSEKIELVDVGPRDGLQSDAIILATPVKLELIKRLVAAGVRAVEVASFVNPKRVPQMADAEAVFAGLQPDDNARYIGLVLNRKGFDRALAAGCRDISMVTAATDEFGVSNQGMPIAESLAVWNEIAPLARAAKARVELTISVSFGCPFAGEVSLGQVIAVAQRAATAQPDAITLADTIGVAVPKQVRELFQGVRNTIPANIALRAHFHNTRNTAIANAQVALETGVRSFDASVGGIGGCPFAPNATGNVASEDLLYLFERSGFSTGIDLQQLIATAHWLGGQLGKTMPSMLSRAGAWPKRR